MDRLSASPAAPPGFLRLERRGPSPGAQAGCTLLLGVPLALLGIGLVVAYVVNPAGKGDMWVMPVVGGAFGLVGLVLIYAGLRGTRGLKVPLTEIWREDPAQLVPGGTVRLRVRQPGPVALESFRVKVLCERVYRRQVSKRDSSTVEDQETLWEQALLDIRGERVASGDALARDLVLELPSDARPTGPAEPDGTVRWTIEVWIEAGFLRAAYNPFEIAVRSAAG